MREKNILAIKNNLSSFETSIIEKINSCNENGNTSIEVLETKTKSYTAKITKNSKTTLLHSMYDPEKEASILAKEVEENSDIDLVFVIGIGAGYLVNALRKIKSQKKIAVIEPSISFFNILINSFPIANILSDKDITFFIGADETKDIETFVSLNSTKKVRILITRSYINIFYNEVVFYQKATLDIVDKKIININTLARFEKLWAYNISGNVSSILFNYGANKFFGKYKNTPVIVVSAGPSLSKNINKLKSMSNKAIIVAVDTAIKPLSLASVIPHFIITIDPQKKNAKYFRGVDTSKSILIAESSIDREVLDSHKGELYFLESIFPLASLFMKPLGKRGEIRMGGSVSTAAIDFALKLGSKTIIMVGLDLSFPNHQTHVKGSYHEEDFFTQINKLDSYDSRIYTVLVQGNLVKEKNIYGENIFIDSRFQMYRNWYENYIKDNSDIKFFNATEGGVHIKNMENITLDEVMNKFDTNNIKIEKEVDSISESEKTSMREGLHNRLKNLHSEIISMKPSVLESIKLANEFEYAIKHHKNTTKIVSKLNELDYKLMNFTRTNDFISIVMQRTIKLLSEGFDLDDTVESEYKVARNSLKLYEAILDSIEFNCYVIERSMKNLMP